MRLADTGQGPFEGMKVMADGAVEAGLVSRYGRGDGHGDGVFGDIQAQIEFSRFYGVVVSSHSVNESERISLPPIVGTFLRLCPAGQHAYPMSGNHTVFSTL
jgi:hypothetical protein